MIKYLNNSIFIVIVFFSVTCDEQGTDNENAPLEGECRLSLSIKEEWVLVQSDHNVRFLMKAQNIGDLPIDAIHVTANIYFKNDHIFKTRFSINDLNMQPEDSIEKYGIIFETTSDRFSTSGLSKDDLDRIVYNAPYYTCLR